LRARVLLVLIPLFFFAHADKEFLIFINKRNELKIIVSVVSDKTNLNGSEIKKEMELI
jgi:hypothetical protein